MKHSGSQASSLLLVLFIIFLQSGSSTYVNPASFLDSRLAKGSWMHHLELEHAVSLFEGGWIWTESGNLDVTHICRATTSEINGNPITIEPGELVNGTCYISGVPSLSSLTGVQSFTKYEVLMKLEDEIYEWVPFNKETGDIPHGTVIGGIGSSYEPILICRKFYNGTAGNLRASKAVLGKFSPKDGKCFYELEFGNRWIKWDFSFGTENFQLLVLRGRSNPQCAEPRENFSKSVKLPTEEIPERIQRKLIVV